MVFFFWFFFTWGEMRFRYFHKYSSVPVPDEIDNNTLESRSLSKFDCLDTDLHG